MAQRVQHTPGKTLQTDRNNAPGVSGQDRAKGQGMTGEDGQQSPDYSMEGSVFCSRVRGFLSYCSIDVIVKTTVIMATLITAVTFILVLVIIPQVPQIRSTLLNRLEDQTSTLQAHVKIRSALISHLWDQLSTFEEHADNRSALVSRLEGQVFTLEEHLKTRSALVSRLEGQVSTLEEKLDQERTIRTQLANQKLAMCKATPKRGNIFHLESPKRRYMYDLGKARQACAEKGAVLASYDQLHVAWLDGLERCDCGWLSDGTARYPMQEEKRGCGSRRGIHMCTWNPTWNAWCFRSIGDD